MRSSDDYTDDEEPPLYASVREHEATRIVYEKEAKTIVRNEELGPGWTPALLEANLLDSGRLRNFGDGSLLSVVRTAPFSAPQHANVHLLGRTLKRTESGRPGGTLKGWQAGARKMFVALSSGYDASQRSTSVWSRADGSTSRPAITLLDSDDSDATEDGGGGTETPSAARQTETEKMAAHADLVMEVASAQDHGRPVEPHEWAPDADLWLSKESAFRNPPFDPPPARFSYVTRGDAYKGLPTPASKGRGANKMYTHKKLDAKGERERFGRHFRCLADGRGFRKVAGRVTGPDDYFSGVSGASLPWFDGEGSDVDDGEGGTVVALECTRVAGKEFSEVGKALLESTLGDHAKATREAVHKITLDVSTDYGVGTVTYTTVLNRYRRERMAEVVRSFEYMTRSADEKPEPPDSDSSDESSDDDRGDRRRGRGDRRRKLDDDKKRKAKKAKTSQRQGEKRQICQFYAKYQITKRKADKCHTPEGQKCPKGRHSYSAGEYKKYKAKYE